MKIENPALLSDKKAFVVCPECYTSTRLMIGIVHVIGVIGGDLDALQQEGMNLKVPVWNESDKTTRCAGY